MNIVSMKIKKVGDTLYYLERVSPYSVLKIPNTIRVISDNAIRGNEVKKVYIPKSVERIGFKSLEDIGLEKLVFEAGSNLHQIGYGAFSNNHLKEVELPESVVNIAEQVFYNNPSMVLYIRNLFTKMLVNCGADTIMYQGQVISGVEQLKELQLQYVLKRIEGRSIPDSKIEEILFYSRMCGCYTEQRDAYKILKYQL